MIRLLTDLKARPLTRFGIAFLPLIFLASVLHAGEIEIEIDKLRSKSGGLAVAVFHEDHAKEFPTKGDAAFRTVYVDLGSEGPLPIRINDVPAGRYAVSIYHDEDGNKKLNTNFIGIPNEGMGASQDAPAKFGPPKFQDAAFVVEGDLTKLKIPIRY